MEKWDIISTNWEYVLPPSRPSDAELNRISCYVNSFSPKEPVAILGSTIEYRDLLYSMGFERVYVLEKNISFHDSLNKWKVFSCENEILIEGDWLQTLPNYSGFFNFCLSDLTMGNIPYCNRKRFYSLIYNSLKYGGIFFDKVLTNEIPFIRLQDISKKYSNLAVNIRSVNNFSCEALFCSELLYKGIIDTTESYEILSKEFKASPRLMKFIDKSHLITPEGCIWYYGKNWDLLKNEYFSSFSKTTSFEDEDLTNPYCRRAKHFINYKLAARVSRIELS